MKYLTLSLLSLLLVACSSGQQHKHHVDEMLTHEKDVKDAPSLEGRINEIIRESKTLSEKDKVDLEKLLNDLKVTQMGLREKSYKLRAVLVEELLSEKPDDKEIIQLKKDIRNLEKVILNNTLKAVDKIRLLVEKDPQQKLYLDHTIFIDRNFR